jgi:hypothetical protein
MLTLYSWGEVTKRKFSKEGFAKSPDRHLDFGGDKVWFDLHHTSQIRCDISDHLPNLTFVVLASHMSITIKQVSGRSGIEEFIRFPFSLYKDSEFWIPPLNSSERQTLDPLKNPAQANAPSALFLAYIKDRPVGRLAVIALKGQRGVEGRFGWFDVIDDPEVSKSLFVSAEQWLRENGATFIKGPMGFTNLDKAGMLTFGFNELPTIATIYNHPYYNDHLVALGFTKSVDYVEFEFTVPESIPHKVTDYMDVISKRYGVRLLDAITEKSLQSHGQELFDLVNETHRNLYGFNLLSEEMKQYYIRNYLPFIKPDFVALVVNDQNKLVAYGLTMPSYAIAFQKAHGTLFPLGFWHIYRASRHVSRADLLLIGVADSLRNKGVTSLIFHRLLNTFMKYGIQRIESNPELEDNQRVQALWQKYEYRQHKRRRVYQRDL